MDIALKRKAELEANFIKFRDKFSDIKMLESLKFGQIQDTLLYNDPRSTRSC